LEIQSRINQFWNAASDEYDKRASHTFQSTLQEEAWKKALSSFLPAAPCDVLDVGTGTGVMAVAIAELGYRVVGIDLSEGMLEQARRKAKNRDVLFESGDAIDPPGEAESIDAVVSRHVFWTLTDPRRALENWLRLLRRGGQVLIIDGLYGAHPDSRLGDIANALPLLDTSITLDDVRHLVEESSFVDVSLHKLAEVDRIENELMNRTTATPHYAITAFKHPQ
jgi:ubiquinone/menaquinone biosynthesis C-methylase UbiE